MNGTVIDITSEGDGEKKPFRFTVRLESSGEQLALQSWEWPKLALIKELLQSDIVYTFDAQANTFGNFGEQLRLKSLTSTGMHSTKKMIREFSIDNIKNEIALLIKNYCNKEPLKTYLETFILNDPRFFTWPAATRMHHNFPGGLAMHSLNVAKVALAMSEVYRNEHISLPVLVAGALLHDIGKIEEYKEDGSRTSIGNLLGHHSIGMSKISMLANRIGIEPNTDVTTCMLNHIILSHHEKLEFGSPVQPQILEAIIVAKADALDAAEEAGRKAVADSSAGFFTTAPGTPSSKIFNWGV